MKNKLQKPILPENTPGTELPYRKVCGPFRLQYIYPGNGIEMYADANGNVLIQGAGGAGILDLVAGDNIEITRNAEGKFVISAVDTAVDIAAGQNITIDIDPETGAAIISSISGSGDEHYQGIFDTAEDLIAYDTDPEVGDYGMIKQIVYSDGGDMSWNGRYKYCFYISGAWTVVDQMLTFTDNVELLQQFYSVGGSSPVIYLHKVAQTGSFKELRDVPIVATPVVTVEGSTITATCATEGADIWYTTDGSMPHVNGTKYTGPITFSGAATYRFVGVKNGMINSLEATVGVDYSLQAPTIELDWHDGTITMNNPNASGTIHYTTDGSTPTSGSTAYSEPFIITEATTFKLIVIDGSDESSVTEQRYEQAANVRNFQVGANMIIGVARTIFTSSEYGEAHYEMYDQVPTYSSPVSEGTIEYPYYDLENNPRYYTVRVFAEGMVPSGAARSPQNGMQKPTAPGISFDPETKMVTLTREGETKGIQYKTGLQTNGCTIRYTLDGSAPTADSLVYTEPFQVSGDVTVKAVLIAYGQHYSDVAQEAISLLSAPTAEIDYLTGNVTMHNPNDSGTIYYTTDGSTPTSGSTQYSAPFVITAATTFKMIVVDGDISSPVSEQTFEQAQPPRISFRGTNGNTADFSTGIYKVLMTNPNTRGWITYTTDGTEPTDESTGYHTDFDAQYFDGAVTYKARVFHVGKVPSATTTAENGADSVDGPTFLFNDGKITIALTGNTTDVPLQTNLNVPEMGARIYYTTDGTTPTSQNGTLYTGPFTLPDGVTQIKAITELYSQYTSEVSVYGYLYFEALQANSEIGVASNLPTAPNLEYSRDGATWQEWRHTTADNTHAFDTITLENVGDRLYVRGTNSKLSDMFNDKYTIINGSGSFKSAGSVQSLVTADGNSTTAIEMSRLFYGFAALKSAPLFPATTLVHDCYRETLANCSSLTSLPAGFVLPATNLETYCYYGMFRGCTSLQSLPDNFTLASTNIRNGCYAYMFYGCESLTSLPDNFTLPATSMKSGCYSQMFMNCTSLASLPSGFRLPATSLDSNCYASMFTSCTSLNSLPEGFTLPANTLKYRCYSQMFMNCTSLISLPNSFTLPATTLETDCYKNMFSGCRFLMSDNASTFNFSFSATLPQTVGGITYSTPRDMAEWMGNLCGFDYMVPESALGDDVVARIFKDNTTGALKYFPQSTYDASKFFADQYTEKDWMRQERNRDGIAVMQRKTGIGAAKYATDNLYKIYCDTTANGGFTLTAGKWGATTTQTVEWVAGDSLDSIVAQLTSTWDATFAHVAGEDFIRLTACQSSSSYDCTLANNTGGTVVDLSKQCRIGGVVQPETHRVWQGTDLHTLFPDAGIPAANTVQYAKSGFNLSYRCGGNLDQYMYYYEVSGSGHGGVDTYLAEDSVSARMSRVGFASCNGSSNPDAQALYDKYSGSYEAYMEASMVDGESTNANGIVDQTYSVADTVSPFLASVETVDFSGNWIPAFPIFYNAYQVVDDDFGHGIVGANHDISVYMNVDVMAQLNAGGCNISRTAYYQSVAQYNANYNWFYYGGNGTVYNISKFYDGIGARVLAYIRPS